MCATLERPAVSRPDKLPDLAAGGATSPSTTTTTTSSGGSSSSYPSNGRISNPEDEFEPASDVAGEGVRDDRAARRHDGVGEGARPADDADRQNKKPLSDSLFPALLPATPPAAPPPPPLPKKTVAPFQVSSSLIWGRGGERGQGEGALSTGQKV
jgi:hypothetical protein